MKIRTAAAAFAAVLALASMAVALQANWQRVYGNILVSEGGARYTNHPSDPGGPTRYGITIHDVRLYIDKNATAETVRNLTEAQARGIYETRYWKHACVRGPDLPSGLDYSTTDFGVNSGVGRSGKLLRELTGFSTQTCIVTDAVVAKVNAMTSAEVVRLVRTYNARRLAFLRALRTFPVFGRGWTNRVQSVDAISVRMATPGMRGSAESLRPAVGPGKAFDPEDDEVMP